MLDGLIFGWRTAIFCVAVGQMLVLALLLNRTIANRAANRTLALLLIVLAGIVTPWMIGFAGFYDKWRWLTFAPFQLTLGVAPLLHLYVHALVTGAWPPRSSRHLAAPGVQLAFLSASFALPSPLKYQWSSFISTPYAVITGIGVIAGMALYGRAAMALLIQYRALLAAQRSDDHRFAAAWVSRAVIASGVLLAVWSIYAVWDVFFPLGYTGLMGLYVAIAAFALFIAIEGWRHAELPFPTIDSLAVPADPLPAPRDWHSVGVAWAAQVRANGWASDPDLSLAGLARHLGTNSGHLSRALNEGLGMNFSTFVNQLRCDAVAAAITAGSGADLLTLALDAGFSSKASFNRAFQAAYGMAPSAYRRAHVSKHE